MKNKFSIIIPAYNCEKTIIKCVESVLKQKYNLFEIVIVNDGSKDNTLNILNEKYLSNKKIKIISKENSGVSDARNIGIKNAEGDWIIFLDSDDWIEDEALDKINNLIIKNDPDYIITRLIYNSSFNNQFDDMIIEDKKFILDNIICLEYSDKKYNKKYKDCRCIGGKIIKKSLIDNNNIAFPSGVKKFEDGIFNLLITLDAKKILYSSFQFYNYYYDNPTSRMNTVNKEEASESKYVFDKVTEIIDSSNIQTESINYLSFILYILSYDSIMHLDLSKKIRKQRLKEIYKYYKKYINKNIKIKYFSFRKKIEYIFLRLHLIYYLYIFKIKVLKK